MKEKPNSILAALWVIRKTLTQSTPTDESAKERASREMELHFKFTGKLEKDPHPVKS